MATEEHTVKSFDKELEQLNELVMRMGGLAQEQVVKAMHALRDEDIELAREVIARDHMVNFLDVQGEDAVLSLLATRQPVARDLRMVLSLQKTMTDLERVGDEARRIARMTVQLYESGSPRPNERLLRDAYGMSLLAIKLLRQSLDSLARLDVELALETARGDSELDGEFHSALLRLATFIREDDRTVGHVIDVTFILKSLERIGDHAVNISQYVIFFVKGKDVRHVSADSLDDEVR